MTRVVKREVDQALCPSSILALDLVLENADLLDLELDGVAMLEEMPDLETAAVADRAGADEFTGHQGFILGDVFDDLLEREQHAVADAAGASLAVHPHFHG